MPLSKCEAADAENLRMLQFIKKHLRIEGEQIYKDKILVKLTLADETISSLVITVN